MSKKHQQNIQKYQILQIVVLRDKRYKKKEKNIRYYILPQKLRYSKSLNSSIQVASEKSILSDISSLIWYFVWNHSKSLSSMKKASINSSDKSKYRALLITPTSSKYMDMPLILKMCIYWWNLASARISIIISKENYSLSKLWRAIFSNSAMLLPIFIKIISFIVTSSLKMC